MLSPVAAALVAPALAQSGQGWDLRGWAAVEAARGVEVALVGMGVVFSALAVLFFVMVLLQRLLDPKPAPAPASVAEDLTVEPAPVSPLVVAAISVALQLERRRSNRAQAPQAGQAGAGSGWLAARGQQWAANRRIFLRPRR